MKEIVIVKNIIKILESNLLDDKNRSQAIEMIRKKWIRR
jgi:hypothetical protein